MTGTTGITGRQIRDASLTADDLSPALRAQLAPRRPTETAVANAAPQHLPPGELVPVQYTEFSGDGFDAATGEWTCPESGDHLISLGLQMEMQAHDEYYVFVFVNGVRTRDVLYGVAPTYGYFGGSASVVLKLGAGDRVGTRAYCQTGPARVVRQPFRTYVSLTPLR